MFGIFRSLFKLYLYSSFKNPTEEADASAPLPPSVPLIGVLMLPEQNSTVQQDCVFF
jgi:hypothetical protein